MLTIGQAEKLKQLINSQAAVVEGTLASVAIGNELKTLINSFVVTDLKERISPVVGIIRSMEMSHEEAVQRVLKALE